MSGHRHWQGRDRPAHATRPASRLWRRPGRASSGDVPDCAPAHCRTLRRPPRPSGSGLTHRPLAVLTHSITGTIIMIRLLRAALAAAILVVTPALAHNGVIHLGDINISLPFTRATLPNAPVGGGFLTIENAGTEADRLVSATSEVAGETQIHEMAMEGDVMKMRQLAEGLEIPAGETVVLAPGGVHIMFMGLKQAFVEGETVAVTLTFEKAGSVEVLLPVAAAAADMPAGAMVH
ncbi:MAG: copper chaperone PCu(A)C [Devosia sp.]|nr:copper chaperone PCu(A)C [Devosia sp.]